MSSRKQTVATFFPALVAAFLVISCDVTSPDDGALIIEPSELARLSEGRFEIDVDAKGAIRQVVWDRDGAEDWIASLAGLWLAAGVDGEVEASAVWAGSMQPSNLLAVNGVYLLTREDPAGRVKGWPADLGAPATPDGQPLLYGDAMTWQSLHPDNSNPEPELSRPIEGLHVAQAVFSYGSSDLRDLVFLRYTVTNSRPEKISDIHTGFYADFDLGSCGNPSLNAAGYDADRMVAFVYERIEGTTQDCEAIVAGYSFLSDPLDRPLSDAIFSHRIMRKNENPEFGEENVQEPQQLLYALQGLTNAGLPMTDPQTGEETLLAFTGDPVSGEGWVDGSTDVRSLVSLRPFDLAPGESRSFSLVFAAASGPDLADALANLRSRVDATRQRPQLWQF